MAHIFGIDQELTKQDVEKVSGGFFSWPSEPSKPPEFTTMAIGEEGGGWATTLALGEEGGHSPRLPRLRGEDSGLF